MPTAMRRSDFLNGVIDPGFAVHAHHAEIHRIGSREAADAEKRHGDGNVAGADELLESVHRAGKHDAVAGQNQRALGGVEQFDGAIEFGLIVIIAHALLRKLRSGGIPIEFAGRLLGVFGDVDENRAGASGIGDDEGFANGARDVFGARDDHVVLGDRHGDAGDVDFLEGVGAEQLAADLAGDADDGRRIEHGGGDAGDHVGCAGAAGGHGDADAAAGARVAVGHVRGALFVAHENVVELGFAEGVVDGKNRAAGISENMLHAQLGERFAENFCAGELHSVLPNCACAGFGATA